MRKDLCILLDISCFTREVQNINIIGTGKDIQNASVQMQGIRETKLGRVQVQKATVSRYSL